MSTLPLSFRLRNAVVEKHQSAKFSQENHRSSDRSFNRAPVPVTDVKRSLFQPRCAGHEALGRQASWLYGKQHTCTNRV